MSAYLDTRVSLFAQRLWRDAELDALIEVPDDDVSEILAQRGLPQLSATQAPAPDSRSLEQRIIGQILDETRVLIRPLTSEARAFFTFWTARFEISNVKTLLRSKLSAELPATALGRLTPMGGFGRLDAQELAHAEDVRELLRRLEAGPLAALVRRARRAFEESHDPFHLDAALDHGYYEGLIERARPLEAELGEPFRKLMGQLVDRVNLVWLLRYRFNYGLPPAQVYYLLVPSRYRLPRWHLQQLAAQNSLADVLAGLPPPWQALLAGSPDVPTVFARMEYAGAVQAQAVLRSRAPAVARAFAYLILRERDLRAVRAVLRGRHLRLSNADIRGALNHPLKEAA